MKSTGGVPIEMVPNHKKELESVNGTLPVLRLLDVLIPSDKGYCLPVFFANVAMPLAIFL